MIYMAADGIIEDSVSRLIMMIQAGNVLAELTFMVRPVLNVSGTAGYLADGGFGFPVMRKRCLANLNQKSQKRMKQQSWIFQATAILGEKQLNVAAF